MKRERIVVLWLMFLPGLLSVAGWGLSLLLGIAPPNYGFFIVMALLTVPWTGVCAAFLTGTAGTQRHRLPPRWDWPSDLGGGDGVECASGG